MKLLSHFSRILFTYIIIFLGAGHATITGHGFGEYTHVHMADGSLEEIGLLCRRVLDKKLAITTYDTSTATLTTARIKNCGKSKTERYVEFSFEGSSEIICTPTQEFYLCTSHSWVPAYQLNIGDKLLCKNSIQTVTDFKYVQKKLEVYTLEIANTHTFFVGYRGVLTHNMVIPAAFGLGMSIPFGSAAGASAGSFFGPPALVIGAVLGSLVGAFVSMTQHDSVPSYKIDVGNTHYIDNFIHQQNAAGGSNSSSAINGSSCMSPMPNGPNNDDEENENKTARMPDLTNKQKLNHIFKKAIGHREFSQDLYNAMNEMVSNALNHLGPDKYGVQWFAKILENGEQMWAKAQAGEVVSAGINQIPRTYCPIRGLVTIVT